MVSLLHKWDLAYHILFRNRINEQIGHIENSNCMPKFLDSHNMKGVKPETLKKLQDAPEDEFGVKHLNLIYNEDDDRMYCFLEAPNKEAIAKHHDKFGYKCDYILEVNSTL